MAADSSMGFHQGITASLYNHHMLSFQSNSDVGISGDATGAMVMAPGSVGGGSSNAGLFLSANTGVMGNAPGVAPSRTSSGDALLGTGTPKYKYVTGPPSDWSDREVAILKEGLVRYINSSFCFLNCFCLYSTVLFCSVLLLIWNLQGKERRKKPDGFYTGKKMRDMKPIQDKMVASVPIANFHMTPTTNVTPFSISMQHPNQQSQVPKEAPIVDSATQRLLEENNQLLNQISANIKTFKTVENTDLFLRTSNNIKTILSRMSETPGIMGQMPPLPLSINEDHINSLIQLNRLVASYGTTSISHHTKQEP
ncbi:hypothetical protein Zm00014a_014661 [Zea mays]|uniref:Uncharacterized protein n=1 Tax=Zea mays TaxID=4577 RepID=A0A3L6G0K3_MAIZE|nr:hypothetical protein Zm00014a_014661 [Zea mays]